MRQTLYILIFVAFLTMQVGLATEVLHATVDKEDGVYHVVGESIVEAPPEFIYATLIDFDNFHKISSSIPETRFVDSDVPGEVLGYTRVEACVLFFCRSAERLEKIESTPSTDIRTTAIPDSSDFEIYASHWKLTPHNRGTLITYEAQFKPDFWMPPLISNWAIKRKLVDSAYGIGTRIEYLKRHGLTLSQVTEPPKE